MSSRRRNLRRTSRRRRGNPSTAESVGVDDLQQPVVDLTYDDYHYVDLTDSPVVLSDTSSVRPAVADDDNLHSPYLVSDGSVSDDSDLPPVPFKITATPRTRKSMSNGEAGGSSSDITSATACPVCLDSFSQVKASGRRVMANKCGHIFCEECMQGILNQSANARKCPTCRKKLSAQTVHPLFIF